MRTPLSGGEVPLIRRALTLRTRPLEDVAATKCGTAPDAYRGRELALSDQLANVLRMQRDDRSKLGKEDKAFVFECRRYVRLN